MKDFINQFAGYVKTFFKGVFYILTLQWRKAIEIAKADGRSGKGRA